MCIQTKRLTLRPLGPEDTADLYAAVNYFDVVKMTATWPWPFTVEYVRERLVKSQENDQSKNTGLGIFVDGTLAGNMGGHLEAHEETGEDAIWVGYMIGPDWWGKGYMTEALDALCPYVRAKIGNYDIYAEHFFDNPASGRVMEKVGFEHVGPAPRVWCTSREQELPGEQYRLRAEG